MGWLGSAAGGAATGAAIGSFIPGVGTAIGAGVGGLLGGGLGLGTTAEASTIDKDKNYKDLGFFDRASATLSAKTEGWGNDIAGIFGFEDAFGTENQDLLDRLKHERSDDAGTSFQMGGNITGGMGGETQGPQMGGIGAGGQAPNQGISLGRALALEEDPALEQENFNNNNFSF